MHIFVFKKKHISNLCILLTVPVLCIFFVKFLPSIYNLYKKNIFFYLRNCLSYVFEKNSPPPFSSIPKGHMTSILFQLSPILEIYFEKWSLMKNNERLWNIKALLFFIIFFGYWRKLWQFMKQRTTHQKMQQFKV